MRAPTICAKPGCPETSTFRGRCAAHQDKPWKNQSASSAALSRSAAHKRQRRAGAKRAKGRCESCGRRADLQLHHPEPIAHGGEIVQKGAPMLCAHCHRDAH